MEGYAAAAAGASSAPAKLNAAQLGRLRAVLSPFMLRRVKADVLNVGWGGDGVRGAPF